MINPLFEEQLRAGFINPIMIRLHLIGLGAITFLVFLFYPSQPISYFLARSVKPEMFNIALYTILAFISYLTVKTAVFSIQGVKIISLKEWFVYARMPAGVYFLGRVFYGVFYTFFLLLLFLPILIVAASVSAVSPENLASIFLTIYLFSLNIYFLGLLLFMIFRKQHWVLTLLLWFTLLIILFISPTFFPENHPAMIFMKLQDSENLQYDLLFPVVISTGLSLLLILLSRLSLYLYSRSVHD